MNITKRVENILKASRSARNSDFELLLIYMQKSGLNLSERQVEALRTMPSFETIRRTRQKLQEQGKYAADPEVDEARYKKFIVVRNNIKGEAPEALIEARDYTKFW